MSGPAVSRHQVNPTVTCFTVGIWDSGKCSTGPVCATGRARTGTRVYSSCLPDLATKSIVSNAKSRLNWEENLKLGKTEGRRRRQWQRMRWLDGITDSMDVSFSRIWELVKAGEAWLMQSVGSQSRTRLNNWKTAKLGSYSCFSLYFLLAVRCVRKGMGIYLFIFGHAGSSLLCTSFLYLQWVRAHL